MMPDQPAHRARSEKADWETCPSLSTTADERLTLGQDARRSIRDSIEFSLITGGLCGLLFGLFVALSARLVNPSSSVANSLVDGLVGTFFAGFIVWFVGGLTTVRHLAASLIFRFNRTFPGRPAQFLDWAVRAGLLRVNGTAYQFRHQTYQQWIASTPHRRT